jgi:microcystin-dependent protein
MNKFLTTFGFVAIVSIVSVLHNTQSQGALQKGSARMFGAPGMVVVFAGATEPDWCYFPYGNVKSIAANQALYDVIGTTYNTGAEGAGNFRLPDIRGRTVFGQDDMGGSDADRITTAVAGFEASTLAATGGSQLYAQHNHASGSHTHDLGNHTHVMREHTHGFSGTTSQDFYQGGLTSGASYDQQIGSDEHVHTYSGTSAAASWGATGASTSGAPSSNTSGAGSGNTDNAGTGTSGNIPPAIVMNWCIVK